MDTRADRLGQVVIQFEPLAQHHEQGHPRAAFAVGHVDHQCVDDLLHREHGAVDLARSHPHPAAVDGRIRAPVDDRRAARGDLDPVAVAPHAREGVEVALAQAPALGIVPQVQRHGGHGLGDDQLADLVDHAVALLVPGLDRAAQRTGLDLPAVDRQQRHAAHEGRAHVGAPAGGEEPRVRAQFPVDPVEALW